MRGAVVAVGTELLLGDVVNANAAWLGNRLREAGVEVVTSVAVADDLDRLVATVRLCLLEADVLVLCGGLGPTVDDLTREAVAVALDAPLRRDPDLVAHLDRLFTGRGPVPVDVYRQADLPAGAEVLPNPAGTAPGLWLERGDRLVIALPGPPRELQPTSGPVWPRLAERSGRALTTRQVLVAGLGESAVADRLRDLAVPDGVALSYLASTGLVRVRFTAADPALIAPLVAQVDAALGDLVFGHDAQTLDGAVHDLLAARGETVAVAESLTGGLVAAALSTRSGASDTFRGGVVAYATDLKQALAGVPGPLLHAEGAVSAATAAALAAGCRDRLGADWGLATTGVAGPTEQEGKPVGTVFVAVAGPGSGHVRALHLPGDRARVREATVVAALDLLRRVLTGKAPAPP